MTRKNGAKRALSETCKPVVKKPKIDPMLTEVMDAITRAEDLPEDCRKMLIAVLPSSLGLPSEERYPFQVKVVDMVGELLSKMQTKMQEVVDAEASKVTEIEASKSKLLTAVTESEAELQRVTDVTKHRKTLLDESSKLQESKRVALEEAQRAQREGNSPSEAMKKDIETSEALLANEFKAIKDGDFDGGKTKIGVVMSQAKKLGLDDSLVTALPSSCTKMPDTRGQFDKMVLEEFETGLIKKVAELKATVEADNPNVAQRAAAVAAAQAECDEATSAQQRAAGELSEAELEQKEAAKALKDARDAAAQYEPSYVQATEMRDQKKVILSQFEACTLSCFSTLKSKVAKIPEAKCVEVPAEAAPDEPIEDVAKDADV